MQNIVPEANAATTAYDIGANATRWNSLYLATSLLVGAASSITAYNSNALGSFVGPGVFSSCVTTAGNGYYLMGKGIQYGRIYIDTLGVAGTATTTYTNPNDNSQTKSGYTGAVIGQTILVLGNEKAAGYNGSSYSSPGAAGTADNAQGYLRLYSENTGYADLTSYTGGDKTRIQPPEGYAVPTNKIGIMFSPDSATYYTHFSYQNNGNQALVMATQNAATSFIFVNGESYANVAANRWTKLTGASGQGNAPGLQIKQNCVSIGRLIPSGTDATYRLEVTGQTYLNQAWDASTKTGNLTSQVIIANSTGGSVALELWRNNNASWQIANEGGILYFRNNYTTAKQSTYSRTSVSISYNTGNTTFAGSVTSTGGFIGNLTGNADSATAANITSTANGVAYYSNTNGTFANMASKNGALYATDTNGTLYWGTLPIAQGGTNATSFTKDCVIVNNGASTNPSLVSRGLKVLGAIDAAVTVTAKGNNQALTIEPNGTGNMALQTTSGNLTLETSTGTIETKATSSGPIKLTGKTGNMDITTTSGVITIKTDGTTNGDINITTNNAGAISIESVKSSISLSATTTIGYGLLLSGIQGTTINAGSNHAIAFQINNAEKGEFNKHGMFQLNETGTQSTHKLYVNGDSAFNGKVSFGAQASNSITEKVYMQWNDTDLSLDFIFP